MLAAPLGEICGPTAKDDKAVPQLRLLGGTATGASWLSADPPSAPSTGSALWSHSFGQLGVGTLFPPADMHWVRFRSRHPPAGGGGGKHTLALECPFFSTWLPPVAGEQLPEPRQGKAAEREQQVRRAPSHLRWEYLPALGPDMKTKGKLEAGTVPWPCTLHLLRGTLLLDFA